MMSVRWRLRSLAGQRRKQPSHALGRVHGQALPVRVALEQVDVPLVTHWDALPPYDVFDRVEIVRTSWASLPSHRRGRSPCPRPSARDWP